MNQPVDFVDIPTVELGRWVRFQHVPVPAPLEPASFNHVELARHERETVVRRPDVTVTNVAAQRDVSGLPTRVATVLLRLAQVCDAPELSVYLSRRQGDPTVLSVGLSRGSEGILVVDLGEVTRLAAVSASNLVAPLVALQPRLTPALFRPIEVSAREREEMRRSFVPGNPESELAVLRRRGMGDDELDVMSEVRRSATAVGIVGAFSHRGGHSVPSPLGADWIESRAGSYLKLIGRNSSLTFQPADKAALTRVASAALAAAR